MTIWEKDIVILIYSTEPTPINDSIRLVAGRLPFTLTNKLVAYGAQWMPIFILISELLYHLHKRSFHCWCCFSPTIQILFIFFSSNKIEIMKDNNWFQHVVDLCASLQYLFNHKLTKQSIIKCWAFSIESSNWTNEIQLASN